MPTMRGNILGIPIDDVGVMRTLHVILLGHQNKCISFSLLTLDEEEQSNIPWHCYGTSFRKPPATVGSDV